MKRSSNTFRVSTRPATVRVRARLSAPGGGGHDGRIRMQRQPERRGQHGAPILGAEHHVDEDQGEGLWHYPGSMGRAFSPSGSSAPSIPGALPRAGMLRAFSPESRRDSVVKSPGLARQRPGAEAPARRLRRQVLKDQRGRSLRGAIPRDARGESRRDSVVKSPGLARQRLPWVRGSPRCCPTPTGLRLRSSRIERCHTGLREGRSLRVPERKEERNPVGVVGVGRAGTPGSACGATRGC